MKTFLVICLLAVCLFVFAAPALAQNLPDTAEEALGQVGAILVTLGAAFAGFLGFTATNFLKELFPKLSDEFLKKFNDTIVRVVAMATAAVAGFLVEVLMEYAIQLDETGLWKAIVTIVLVIGAPVFSEVFHRLSKVGKVKVAA